MIEEPYFNSNLCYSQMDLYSTAIIYSIQWQDKFGKHEEEVDEEFVSKWSGYVLFYKLSNDEILVLK